MFKFPSVDLSQPSTDPEPHVAVVNDMTSDTMQDSLKYLKNSLKSRTFH